MTDLRTDPAVAHHPERLPSDLIRSLRALQRCAGTEEAFRSFAVDDPEAETDSLTAKVQIGNLLEAWHTASRAG